MKHKPLLNKRKTMPGRGGYAKKIARKDEPKADSRPKEQPKPRRPLPTGLWDALVTKHQLSRDLATMTNTHYVVSVDLMNNDWILVVRGWEPPYDTYKGYQVKHMKSAVVRNPLSKHNMVGDIY